MRRVLLLVALVVVIAMPSAWVYGTSGTEDSLVNIPEEGDSLQDTITIEVLTDEGDGKSDGDAEIHAFGGADHLPMTLDEYNTIYAEAFEDARQRHYEVLEDRAATGWDMNEAGDYSYSGIYYLYCDINGDGMKELFFCQVYNKHGAEYWVYSLDASCTPCFMGMFDADTIDHLEAGYKDGILFYWDYKGTYQIDYQEWTGTEFIEHTLFEGGYDYWNDNDQLPPEPLPFEALAGYYDVSRITDYPLFGDDLAWSYLDGVWTGKGDAFLFSVDDLSWKRIWLADGTVLDQGYYKAVWRYETDYDYALCLYPNGNTAYRNELIVMRDGTLALAGSDTIYVRN